MSVVLYASHSHVTDKASRIGLPNNHIIYFTFIISGISFVLFFNVPLLYYGGNQKGLKLNSHHHLNLVGSSILHQYLEICTFTMGGKSSKDSGTGDIDQDFLEAVDKGQKRTIQKLLRKGANVNVVAETGITAITIAASRGDKAIVKYLLEQGAFIQDTKTLSVAVSNGHIAVVELLLKQGEDVNETGSFGVSALMLAAFNGHVEVAKLLLQQGADVHHADDDGRTALFNAAEFGHTAVAKMLLERSADIEHTDSEGRTALLFAAMQGHIEIVEMLLQRGAKVQHEDNQGRTAIFNAALHGHTEVVHLLKQKGAK